MRTTYEAPTVYSRHTWKMLAGVRMPFGIPIHYMTCCYRSHQHRVSASRNCMRPCADKAEQHVAGRDRRNAGRRWLLARTMFLPIVTMAVV